MLGSEMDALDFRLLNEFQRDFPFCERPFLGISQVIGCSEESVLTRLRALQASGAISRVGAVFRPGAVGVSTLAAMAVSPERLNAVAAIVTAFAEVNHNYEREHDFNLWFVLTAVDADHLRQTIQALTRATGLAVMSLPLMREYRIDLGFDLQSGTVPATRARSPRAVSEFMPLADAALIAGLQGGFALVARPYAELARRACLPEAEVMARLTSMVERGAIKRMGVVVRHRDLGYTANAMVVFDVPDAQVDRVGERIADSTLATLCYLRERHAPDWPYNLFCMIHSRSRHDALRSLAELRRRCGLASYPSVVLFSRQCYKQRGAHYRPTPEVVYG